MISERRLASGYSSFWRRALPLGEAYARYLNGSAQSFAVPLTTTLDRYRAAIVSELSLRIFEWLLATHRVFGRVELSATEERTLLESTVTYLKRLDPRIGVEALVDEDTTLAMELTWRLQVFLMEKGVDASNIVAKPRFPGCGRISSCEGDIRWDSTLCEIKNVERQFRLVDIKQLLVYLALNAAARQSALHEVVLLNLRSGRFVASGVGDLCVGLGAVGMSELLAEIADFVAEDDPYALA